MFCYTTAINLLSNKLQFSSIPENLTYRSVTSKEGKTQAIDVGARPKYELFLQKKDFLKYKIVNKITCLLKAGVV